MAGTAMLVRGAVLCCGCPAVPWELLVTQGCACCCLLWGLVLPAGCQLKLKPNQAQPELCQGMGSAGEERGKKRGWGAAPGTQGLCCCLPRGVTCRGLRVWCGDAFCGASWGASARQVSALGAAVWNDCPSPGTQLGFLL